MQAIILAAGMGKRLGEYTKNNTKCMVSVNGTPLIDRLLGQLCKLSLNRVVIVVGYEGQKLMDYLGNERNGLKIEYVNNPIYDKTNNIYSLALAEKQLQEDDTLLIESDLIFDDGMFNLLMDNKFPNLALVAKYETWMDGTMVKIDKDNNIVNFVTKAAFSYDEVDSYYKTVNIYKFSKEFSRTKYVPFLEAYSKAVGNIAISTAKALVKAGYNTYFFSAVSRKNTPKINGVKYISTNQYASLSDPNKMRGALNGLYNFKAARSLKKLLKNLDNKTTLIHIHTWTKALSSSIWNAAYSLHVPIYLTCHDYFTVCPNGGFFNYKETRICKKKPLSISCLKCNCDSRNYGIKLYRFARGIVQNKLVNILKKTSKFISISSFSENILKENFPKNIIFERVYNPIDAIDFAEKIHPESNKYFLFVGRLSKEKGCELFCQVSTPDSLFTTK